MPQSSQNAPQSARDGQPAVSREAPAIHTVAFARNQRTGLWRATCNCGWVTFGERDEVQAKAATHDMDWIAEPAPQPAAVAP